MTNPYRAMCAELIDAVEQARQALEGWANYGQWVWPESALEQAKRNTTEALASFNRARALLAQPEPVAPTDEEIMELMPQQTRDDLAAAACWGVMRIILNRHAVDHARAVLAKWGRPTPQPVAVSERLPEAGEWVWHCYVGVRFWQHGRYNRRQFFIGDGPESQPATHWLPANALPTPEATND